MKNHSELLQNILATFASSRFNRLYTNTSDYFDSTKENKMIIKKRNYQSEARQYSCTDDAENTDLMLRDLWLTSFVGYVAS